MKVDDAKGLLLLGTAVLFLLIFLLAYIGSYGTVAVVATVGFIATITLMLTVVLRRLFTIQSMNRKILKGNRKLTELAQSAEGSKSSSALVDEIGALARRLEEVLHALEKSASLGEEWLLASREVVVGLHHHSSQLASQAGKCRQFQPESSNKLMKETNSTLRMLHQRLIDAERRVVSALETSSLDHSDQIRHLADRYPGQA